MSFSAIQAADFVTNWQVISHQPNTESGFSATLFKYIGNDPASGFQNGQYVYAIRGTEPEWLVNSNDLSTDVGDIVADGLALDQIVDMYNDWQRLQAWKGQPYLAAKLETLLAENAGRIAAYALGEVSGQAYDRVMASQGYLIDQPTGVVRQIVKGLSDDIFGINNPLARGVLQEGLPATNLMVTGHSLGGHLAAAFTRLFPETGAVAYTVNGAGFATGAVSGLGGTAQINIPNLFNGLVAGAGSFKQIFNLYGDKNPEIVTQNGPGLYQQGTHNAIFIEQDSFFGNAIGHGGEQMTDSLAVYDLFFRMDSSLANLEPDAALVKLKPLFEAASNEAELSLESVTHGLSKLLGLSAANILTEFTREQLYQAVGAIRSAIVGKDFEVVPLTSLSASETLAKSQQADAEGLAYRYALKELNPFVVVGADYAIHNTDGELDRYDPVSGEGTLTEQYLKDRVALLSWKLQANINDDMTQEYTSQTTNSRSDAWKFSDADSATDITVYGAGVVRLPLGGAIGIDNTHHIAFGSDSNASPETLTGGDASDRLYGMGGADILTGGNGADALDGGQGDDRLDGGRGRDTLVGGTGFDTYVIRSGDGLDTVLDADGQGIVTLDGLLIKGSAGTAPAAWQQLGPDTWADTAHGITYTRTIEGNETRLLIHQNNANIIVRHWQEGGLGIVLGESEETPEPETSGVIKGDHPVLDDDASKSGIQPGYDSLNNLKTDYGVEFERQLKINTYIDAANYADWRMAA